MTQRTATTHRRRRSAMRWSTLLVVLAVVAGVFAMSRRAARSGPDQAPRTPAQSAAPAVASSTPSAARADPRAVGPPMAKASVAPARPESIVALGDSVATGYRCGCDAFIKLVGTARAAAEHRGVRTTNRARDGLTSAGLVQQLDDADVSMATGTADVDVVTIGANDFDPTKLPRPECARSAALACYDAELVELHANLTTVVRRLAGARPRPEARIVLTGYWNVFLDGAVGRARGAAYVTNSDALTRRVNGVIRDVAAQEGALYADVYAAFKAGDPDDTRLLLPDGDHPNAAGHRVIADAVDAALGLAAR